MDVLGKQVMHQSITNTVNQYELNLNTLERGIYNVVLVTEESSVMNKRLILK